MDMNKIFKFGTKTMKYSNNSAECCAYGCVHVFFAVIMSCILYSAGLGSDFALIMSILMFPVFVWFNHKIAESIFCRRKF